MPTLFLELSIEESGKDYRDRGWAVFRGIAEGLDGTDGAAVFEVVRRLTHAEWLEREKPTTLEVML